MELIIKNLSYGYESKLLFHNVSLSLKSGDALTILGVNGAGKTTFAKCIMQFIKDYQGMVFIDNILLKSIPVHKLAEAIGYVAPNDISDYDITVLDYISLGLAARIDFFSCPSEQQYRSIVNLCEKYRFQIFLKRKIKTLSQGERQMVSILRVLTQNPSVVVFDEPTAALDLKNQKDLIALMIHLKEQGKIVIQISHNPNHAFQVGGKALLLFLNKTVYGDVSDIVTNEMLSELYETDISIEEFGGKKIVFT